MGAIDVNRTLVDELDFEEDMEPMDALLIVYADTEVLQLVQWMVNLTDQT